MNKDVKYFIKHFPIPNIHFANFSNRELKLLTLIAYDPEKVSNLFQNIPTIQLIKADILNTDLFPISFTKATGISHPKLYVFWRYCF